MPTDGKPKVDWTPPRTPSGKPSSVISPASARGKLRSEYQARLSGSSVKKRRGALKFTSESQSKYAALPWGAGPDTSPRSRGVGAGVGSAGRGRGRLRQSSLLDFCSITNQREDAVASIVSTPWAGGSGAGSSGSGVVEWGEAFERERRTATSGPGSGPVMALAADLRLEGEELAGPEGPGIGGERKEAWGTPEPLDLMETSSMLASARPPSVRSPSPSRSPSPMQTSPPVPRSPHQSPPSVGARGSNPLLGGAGAGYSPSTVGATPIGAGVGSSVAGGGGGNRRGNGGGGVVGGLRLESVYSDRFIPSRTGSSLEGVSPFLAIPAGVRQGGSRGTGGGGARPWGVSRHVGGGTGSGITGSGRGVEGSERARASAAGQVGGT
ncbi:unnamed protein product, partial [Choristocarpus tenellus]